MKAVESRLADGSRALRVHIDPLVYCPALRDHLVDDIYALLLTSYRAQFPQAIPHVLSDGLLLHVLDETETALQQLPALSSHEHVAIAGAFDEARRAQPGARAPRQRNPGDAYESALLAQARRIQDVIAPAMARLDRRLASYGAALRASGLQAGIARLGLQAELGLRLRLDGAARPFVPRLFGQTRRCGLEGLQRTTFNGLDTFQKMVEAIHDASTNDTSWLQVATLNSLHAVLLATLPGFERAGRLRTHEMRIRSAFDGHVSVLEVPGSAVEAAFRDFAGAFDVALWRPLHPVIRAALAHVEFVRIHPYADGNGRLSRLLLQGLLHEDGIPLLPLEALLAWNRVAYLDRVARAIQQRDVLGFVHFLLKMIDQAITVGRQMIRVLKPHCAQIRDSLLALGLSGRLALIAAEHAGSMVLGPDPQLIQRTLHGVETCWYLDESRTFDPVDARFLNFTASGYDCTVAYSSLVARSLMATPLMPT
jgi:fido (protein-threonine AMPylation protein)